MKSLIAELKLDFPNIKFIKGDCYSWSPADGSITYKQSANPKDQSLWSILHELAHANLNHKTYALDFELLKMEVEAWDNAKTLAKKYNIKIDEDHVQDCLDTYRNWLHARSTCPTCSGVGFQASSQEYKCFNCLAIWQVTSARFCRPYRKIANK